MVKRAKSSRVIYSADFETTTDPNDCRVWAWGIADISSPTCVDIGNDIASFLDYVSRRDSICYFHNLKFDGMFIMWHLLKNGFTFEPDTWSLRENEMTAIIDDMGKWYTLRVKWESGCVTEFRDSYKKLPMGVKAVAKAYKLEVEKGEIDYDAYRPVGHEITNEERRYITNDVRIIAEALAVIYSQGMQALTVGSDALKEYKGLKGGSFDSIFPVLSLDMDEFIRRAYRGGFTYCDPRFQGRVVSGGNVYDVNSLYPSIMLNELMPWGLPEYVSDGPVHPTDTHPLTIQSVTLMAKLKPGHIPCIQIKGNSRFVPNDYIETIDEPTTIHVTNVDLDLYAEQYDLTIISWNGGLRFRAASGLFADYIGKWSKVKKESTGGLREVAKLFLNSLYGKFATNPNVTGKIPYLDPKTDTVKFKRGATEVRDPVYTPVGVFITSHGRALTVRAAQSNYAQFAYADTDSLHLIGDEPSNLNIDPQEFGAWKHEYQFDAAFYIRAKAYCERVDGQYVTRIAGLPDNVREQITFDDLKPGAVFAGKMQPKSVPGGVVLADVPFTLSF